MILREHFKLNETPFNPDAADPRYLYLTDETAEALDELEFNTLKDDGPSPYFFAGPRGSGKTTMMRRIWQRLDGNPKFHVVLIPVPPELRFSNSLLRHIMGSFRRFYERRGEKDLAKMLRPGRTYDHSIDKFEQYVNRQYAQEILPVLILDQAENISPRVLKLMHYFLNIELNKKLMQLVLTGQDPFAQRIYGQPELYSRMTPIILKPLAPQQIQEMLEFRWMVAADGKKGAPPYPFTSGAYREIDKVSKGLPRDAVRIANLATLRLAARGLNRADAAMIREVAKRFEPPQDEEKPEKQSKSHT